MYTISFLAAFFDIEKELSSYRLINRLLSSFAFTCFHFFIILNLRSAKASCRECLKLPPYPCKLLGAYY